MAGNGGRRPGAGRKKGSKTKKTRLIAEQAAAEGITPLEVMLKAMRAHYDKGMLDAAAAIAKDAAPYMHPRLASVQHSGDKENPIVTDQKVNVSGLPDKELDARIAELLAKTGKTTAPGVP